MATRNKNSKFNLLLESAGNEHLIISGRKLPTYKQVLLCFLAHSDKVRREDSSKRKRIGFTAANAVIEQVEHHYNNAGIFILPKKNLRNQIWALHHKYVDLRKTKSKLRATNHNLVKFRENLNKTMPLWPKHIIKQMICYKNGKNAVEKKAIDEEIAFVENMMTSRTGLYTSKDIITSKYREMRKIRQQEAEARASKHPKDDPFLYFNDVIDSGSLGDDYSDNKPEETRRKHRRTVKQVRSDDASSRVRLYSEESWRTPDTVHICPVSVVLLLELISPHRVNFRKH